jgi:hypothetical protein
MISMLIGLVIIVLILILLFYLVNMIPDATVQKFARIVLVVVAAIVLIVWLARLGGFTVP